MPVDREGPDSPVLTLTDPAGGVPLTISAEVGGRRYQASGSGECVVEPNGTIYDVPTEQWAARFSGDGPIQRVKTTHKISTVTAGGTPAGRAKAELRRSGAGATLRVDGTHAEGVPVRITPACARFEQNAEDNG